MSHFVSDQPYNCRECRTFLGYTPEDDGLCDRCRAQLNEAYRLTYLILLNAKAHGLDKKP